MLPIENAMEERSYDRCLVFHTPKTSFLKNTQKQRAKLIFSKKWQFFNLNADFFNKFSELEMKISAKEARRYNSKIEFRRPVENMKKWFWTSWRSTKSTNIWRSGGGFGRRICKVGKGAQVKNLLFYWFFCASVYVGHFLLLNNTLQAWDPPTFRVFFGLIFLRNGFLSQQFCC